LRKRERERERERDRPIDTASETDSDRQTETDTQVDIRPGRPYRQRQTETDRARQSQTKTYNRTPIQTVAPRRICRPTETGALTRIYVDIGNGRHIKRQTERANNSQMHTGTRTNSQIQRG
jgi:hypothetical protein